LRGRGGSYGSRRILTNLAEVTHDSRQTFVLEIWLGRSYSRTGSLVADLVPSILVGRSSCPRSRVNGLHVGSRVEGRERIKVFKALGVTRGRICEVGTLAHDGCQEGLVCRGLQALGRMQSRDSCRSRRRNVGEKFTEPARGERGGATWHDY
jgi:hypothetical protein